MKKSNSNMSSSDMYKAAGSALRVEQTDFFLQQSVAGMLGAIPFALIVAYLFLDSAPHLYLGGWVVAVYAMLALRIGLSRKWLAETGDSQRCEEIRNSLLIIWGLSGFVWAAGPFLFMPVDDLTNQFFILTVLSLGAIGTLAVVGSYLAAYLLFLYPVMGFQFIWFAWQADQIHMIIAGLIFLLLLILTISAKGLQANYLKHLNLRHETSELLTNMSSFRDALEHATDSIAIFSRGGLLEYSNPALGELSGYKQEELLGKHWKEIYSDIDQALDFFKSDDSTIGQPWQGKLHLRHKQGKEITTTGSFSPVLDRETGLVSQCIVIQRDVEAEEFIRQRMEKLQRAESLSVMAGGIAHDFNNLLTSIMGSSALVAMSTGPNHEANTHCERINEACQKAAELCNQMIAYSGQGKYNVKSLDIAEMLKGMRGGLHANLHSKLHGHGKVFYQVGDSLPAIEADEGQIRQVITNLVINASEAMESRKEGGSININAYQAQLSKNMLEKMYAADDAKEGCFVCLEIIDNGEGMDKNTLDRVFDPFFTTRFMGRGLGLPAVMGVVFGHAGALNINSQIDSGTVIQVYFPCSDSQGDLFHADVEDHTASIIAWSGMGTVLIVDDDKAILTVASNMIERMGFQVLCADGGAEAMDLYDQHREQISFVLLDWSMPEMDGEAVAKALRQLQPDIKILLSSGYSEEMIMQNFATTDVTGFVQKPYSFEQLKYKLRDVISA
ncbi:MAG: response regulator [Mariprofundaceae bacterium]